MSVSCEPCPAIGLHKITVSYSSATMGFIGSTLSLLSAVLVQHIADLTFIMIISVVLVTLFLVLTDMPLYYLVLPNTSDQA
jgi:hypothetical protein